jgi:hypothetical protein
MTTNAPTDPAATTKATKALPKVKANELAAGQRIRFNTSQVLPMVVDADGNFISGVELPTNTTLTVASVHSDAATSCGQTGRGARSYLVELANGQWFKASPSQRAHLVG